MITLTMNMAIHIPMDTIITDTVTIVSLGKAMSGGNIMRAGSTTTEASITIATKPILPMMT